MENGYQLPPDDDGSFDKLVSLDALIKIQEAENFERIIQEQIEKLRLREREAFDYRWLEIIPDITQKELDWLWDEQVADAKEQAQLEEQINDIERELEAFRNDLHDSMTPEEIKQLREQQRATQEYFHRKYAWVAPAVKRRDQVLADPDLVFDKWLERRLYDLFNGRA